MNFVTRPSSPATSAAAPDYIVIRTKGWTWMDRTLLAVFLAIYPIAVLFGTFLAGSRTTSSVVPNIIVLGIGFACLYLVAEELMAVRRIELGPSGVGFRFFIHTEHRLWTDLEPKPGGCRAPRLVCAQPLQQWKACLSAGLSPQRGAGTGAPHLSRLPGVDVTIVSSLEPWNLSTSDLNLA